MKGKTVKLRVPATTANCGPGFDSIGIACGLYNELELTLREEDRLTIEIYGEGRQVIPCDERNIVWKAIQTLLEKADAPYKGARIKMTNRIPLARGLGSSAAAIVSGLAAANAAIGSVYDPQSIFQLATQIEGHPDNVAPAIFGGATISVVSEGKAQCLSFLPALDLKLVAAIPEFNLSTKAARKALPEVVPMQDAVFNVGRAALLAGALMKGELHHLKHALNDRLHQPYRSSLVPGMPEVFQAALECGAIGAALSGAGPCLIAFAVENTLEIGQAMTKTFKKHNVASKYMILDIEPHGVQLLE